MNTVESSKEACFVYEQHECTKCHVSIKPPAIAVAYFEKELCQSTQKLQWRHKKWLCMDCGNIEIVYKRA
jgi:predicted RNA-binding Zn-ribbon protein involved in translation (DUF1610 family)